MPPKYPKRVEGFRSGLERDLAAQLDAAGVGYEYEPKDGKLKFHEEKARTYLPDFRITVSGRIIEGKGRFTATDRAKFLLVKAANPNADIRFVFSNSKSKLNKTSKTTYGMWCEKHGFPYADKVIPKEWLA